MAEPVLRWAGGKRQHLDKIFQHIPPKTEINTYYEPFFGGGSVFFAYEPQHAKISDINPKLINFYQQLRDDPTRIINRNKELDKQLEGIVSQQQRKLSDFTNFDDEDVLQPIPDDPKNSDKLRVEFYERKREEFNNLRDSEGNCSDLEREAILFFFLNRTCWNGLYRTNQDGDFNVPIGRQWTKIRILERRIHEAQKCLTNAELEVGDYKDSLESVGEDDLVFLDPPYPAGPEKSSFQDYHPSRFSLDQQEELAELAVELDSKGAYVVITNEPSDEIMDIYDDVGLSDEFEQYHLEGARMISSTFDERTDIGDTDIILTNYEQSDTVDIFSPE
jgi:DNA adenine methylase